MFKKDKLIKSGRYYDIKPLELDNYNFFMNLHGVVNFIFFGSSMIVLFFIFLPDNGFINMFGVCVALVTMLVICPLLDYLNYYFFMINNNRTIKLYNNKFRFYKNGKVIDEYKFNKNDVSGRLDKTYVGYYLSYKDIDANEKIWHIVIFIFAMYFGGILFYATICLSLFLVAMYDKAVKKIIYYKRNGSLDNFSPYLKITIGNLYRVRAGKQINYFSNDEYMSLRQYFFDVLDRNLNTINKLMY